jgi:internalin A
MDNKSSQPPISIVSRKWLVRRLYPSTWGVMLLAVAILSLIEIPGRRASATTYAHGWPAIYLHRDYANAPEFIASFRSSTGWSPGYTMPTTADSGLKSATDFWIDSGWPWEVERTLNPWSLANVTDVSAWAIALDCVAAALAVLAAGWIFQRWRGRHRGTLFRFRLRTLLIGVTLFSIVCACWTAWHHEWRREQDEISHLPTGALKRTWPNHPYAWVPPTFLPESLLKVGGIGKYFNRITRLELDDDNIVDGSLLGLEALTRLKGLELNGMNVTEAGLNDLARLPRLTKLAISQTGIADAGLERLAAITSLSDLSIRCYGVTAAGINRLRALHQLRSLDVQGLDDEAISRLNNLTGLEKLSLSSRLCTQVHLARLPRLRELRIKSLNDLGPTQPDRLKSLELESLPALESLTVESGTRIRLNDLPSLSQLEFWGTTLDEVGMRQVRDLPHLESLSVFNDASTVGAPFELHGMAKLRSLSAWGAGITEIRLRNLPSLESVALLNNSGLRDVEVRQLPALRSLTINGSSLVPAVDLRELGLISLTITDLELTIDGGTYVPDRPHARQLPGLTQLSQLEELSLPWTKLDADILDGIARIGSLKSLNLTGTWLTDTDLARLKPLANLTDLDLSNTDVTDAGLDMVQDMPGLASLRLFDTLVTDAGIQRLRKRRPNLEVSFSARSTQAASRPSQPERAESRPPTSGAGD